MYIIKRHIATTVTAVSVFLKSVIMVSAAIELFPGGQLITSPYPAMSEETNAVVAFQIGVYVYPPNSELSRCVTNIIDNPLYSDRVEMLAYNKYIEMGLTNAVVRPKFRYQSINMMALIVDVAAAPNEEMSQDFTVFSNTNDTWNIAEISDVTSLFAMAASYHPLMTDRVNTNYFQTVSCEGMITYHASSSADAPLAVLTRLQGPVGCSVDTLLTTSYPHLLRVFTLAASGDTNVFKEACHPFLYSKRDELIAEEPEQFEQLMLSFQHPEMYRFLGELRGGAERIAFISKKMNDLNASDILPLAFKKENDTWYLVTSFWTNSFSTTTHQRLLNNFIKNPNLRTWMKEIICQNPPILDFSASSVEIAEGATPALLPILMSWKSKDYVHFGIDVGPISSEGGLIVNPTGVVSVVPASIPTNVTIAMPFSQNVASTSAVCNLFDVSQGNCILGQNTNLTINFIRRTTLPDLVFGSDDQYSVSESNSTIPIYLSAPWASNVSVSYKTKDADAVRGIDYDIPGGGNAEFASGQTTTFLPVSVLANLDSSSSKAFDIIFNEIQSGGTNFLVESTRRVWLKGNSSFVLPVVQFDGARTVTPPINVDITVPVMISRSTNIDVSVDYTVLNDGAELGVDYSVSNSSGKIVFPPNSSFSTNLVVTVFQNSNSLSTKTLNVILANPSAGYLLGQYTNYVLSIQPH